MKKQTFNIPDGCKTVTFEQVGNQVITTFEPEIKFKEGDFIYEPLRNGRIVIFKNIAEYKYVVGYCSYILPDYLGIETGLFGETSNYTRLATESEKQQLVDALAKEGKMWDAEKCAIVDLKYIPKVGDCVKIYDKTNVYFGVVSANNVYGCMVEISGNSISNGLLDYSDYSRFNNGYSFTKITPEELQAEFNKIGYQYDFETHTASKIRFEPKFRENYYYVDYKFDITEDFWYNCKIDNNRFKIGNCYKTHEEAEPRRQHYLSFKD